MAATTAFDARQLPDDLPFHIGDIIGAGAFATYSSVHVRLTHLNLESA
jgi:hypothetical protein